MKQPMTVKPPVKTISILLLMLCASMMFVTLALAALPTWSTDVGDQVTDGVNPDVMTVTTLFQDDGITYAVLTDNYTVIYVPVTVAGTIPDPGGAGDWTVETFTPNTDGYTLDVSRVIGTTPIVEPGSFTYPSTTLVVGDTMLDPGGGIAWTVNSVVNNPNGTVTLGVSRVTGSTPVYGYNSFTVVDTSQTEAEAAAAAAAAGVPGAPEGNIPPPPAAAGDSNSFHYVRQAADGSKGSNAYGVRICAPDWLGGGCIDIAKPGSDGGDGSTGPTIVVPSATTGTPAANIQTVSINYEGIHVASIGGDGGQGGSSYGNIPAYSGGDAGAGGNVTVTANSRILTSGNNAQGIFVQSRSGQAGAGGDGIFWASGGAGGSATAGGTVTVTYNGPLISTTGTSAYGIFTQSIGGSAGSGGDSWGLVGTGGSSVVGGNGGTVTTTNNGNVLTDGSGSHGIFAQSLGGLGGDGGSAGGIVALGGNGSAGGSGGAVSVSNGANAMIETLAGASHGILAQSIGGGGGNGGTGGGIVGLGAEGSGGGNASTVSVGTGTGSSILTHANGSSAILAQSIGGGGGNGGVGAGLVGLGSSASGGGEWQYGDSDDCGEQHSDHPGQ